MSDLYPSTPPDAHSPGAPPPDAPSSDASASDKSAEATRRDGTNDGNVSSPQVVVRTQSGLPADHPGTASARQQSVHVMPGERARDAMHDGVAHARAGHGWLRKYAPWLAGLLLTLAWDRAVYLTLSLKTESELNKLNSSDWYRTLRIVGAPWVWFFVAAILVLYDAGKGERVARTSNTVPGLLRGGSAALRRATFLLLSALLSGGAAELVKGLVGRYKPENTDGYFAFAPFHERFVAFRWNDLGFPSSHAALAFGACFSMSILFPRAKLVFITMAIGCAVSRLLVGAHFLSDTYAAVLLAFVVTRGVYLLDRRNNGGVGVDLVHDDIEAAEPRRAAAR